MSTAERISAISANRGEIADLSERGFQQTGWGCSRCDWGLGLKTAPQLWKALNQFRPHNESDHVGVNGIAGQLLRIYEKPKRTKRSRSERRAPVISHPLVDRWD